MNLAAFNSFRRAQKAFDEMLRGSASRELKQLADQAQRLDAIVARGEKQIKLKRRAKRKVLTEDREKMRQARLQEKKAQNERKQQLVDLKRAKARLEAKKERERDRIVYEMRKAQRIPTRQIDLNACTPVRLDAKTVVYVKPGQDVEMVKRKFLDRNKRG